MIKLASETGVKKVTDLSHQILVGVIPERKISTIVIYYGGKGNVLV